MILGLAAVLGVTIAPTSDTPQATADPGDGTPVTVTLKIVGTDDAPITDTSPALPEVWIVDKTAPPGGPDYSVQLAVAFTTDLALLPNGAWEATGTVNGFDGDPDDWGYTISDLDGYVDVSEGSVSGWSGGVLAVRSEEHTSELQSPS
jgi:hypothetical protein